MFLRETVHRFPRRSSQPDPSLAVFDFIVLKSMKSRVLSNGLERDKLLVEAAHGHKQCKSMGGVGFLGVSGFGAQVLNYRTSVFRGA